MYSEKKSSKWAAGESGNALHTPAWDNDMNFSKQTFSMSSGSVHCNMLQVLCNPEDAGHMRGQTFWPTEWNLQRNMEYETVGKSWNMEEEEGVSFLIQYKVGSEAQKPVQSLALGWKMELVFYHQNNGGDIVNEHLPDDAVKDGMLKRYLGEGSEETAATRPGKTSCKHVKPFF